VLSPACRLFRLVEAVFANIVGDGRMQHFGRIAVFGYSIAYFSAAYVHQRRLDNVSLKFFDALAAPYFLEFGEVRRLAAGSVHRSQIAGIDQLGNLVPMRQIIGTIGADEPMD